MTARTVKISDSEPFQSAAIRKRYWNTLLVRFETAWWRKQFLSISRERYRLQIHFFKGGLHHRLENGSIGRCAGATAAAPQRWYGNAATLLNLPAKVA
eukprot:2178587-Pleurochrysis_carterae.AAC.2